MEATRILETCLYVDDLDAAEAFYGRALGLRAIAKETGRHVFFRCGDGVLLVFDPAGTAHPAGGSLGHGATGAGHAAFAVRPAELDAWRIQLAEQGVTIEREIAWPSGGRSLYFRDTAGNLLELAPPSIWSLPDAW